MAKFDFSHTDLYNPIYLPFLYTETRYNILYGGAGSGKSQFVTFLFLIHTLQGKGERRAVIRKYQAHIRRSVFETFKDLISIYNLGPYFRIMEGRMEIHAKGGGSIMFLGSDDSEKLKSLAQCQEVMVEEMTDFEEQDLTQITLRLRGESKERKKIWGLFNPVSQDHWAVKRFVKPYMDRLGRSGVVVDKENDITISKTTYLDNRYAGRDYALEMEKIRALDELYYQVYALGVPGIIRPDSPFFASFNFKKHVRRGLQFDKNEPVYLSFDFNVTNTLIVSQKTLFTKNHYLKEYHLKGVDLQGVCRMVQVEFPSFIYFVTGDPSGNARSAYTSGNINAYQIIAGAIPDADFSQVLTAPISYVNSRFFSNALLSNHPDLAIDEEGCPILIADLQRCKTSSDGGLDKHDCNKHDYGHCSDGWRYDTWAYCQDEFQAFNLNIKHFA